MMEKRMETTIMGCTGIMGGLYWGYILYGDDCKEATRVLLKDCRRPILEPRYDLGCDLARHRQV